MMSACGVIMAKTACNSNRGSFGHRVGIGLCALWPLSPSHSLQYWLFECRINSLIAFWNFRKPWNWKKQWNEPLRWVFFSAMNVWLTVWKWTYYASKCSVVNIWPTTWKWIYMQIRELQWISYKPHENGYYAFKCFAMDIWPAISN